MQGRVVRGASVRAGLCGLGRRHVLRGDQRDVGAEHILGWDCLSRWGSFRLKTTEGIGDVTEFRGLLLLFVQMYLIVEMYGRSM